jgi:opine dehydrogenase
VNNKYEIVVIGAGNGGQAMAGHLALNGHAVILCTRDPSKLEKISRLGGIELRGMLEGLGTLREVTCNLGDAISRSQIIMVASTADAHRHLACRMAPFLQRGHIVVLNPGRTCGAIEFRHVLQLMNASPGVLVGETQSLVYACRASVPGKVVVHGIKRRVLFAASPSSDTGFALQSLGEIYPCFQPAASVLETSLENIGAVLHCPITLFNASAIEREEQLKFYHSITPQVASFIERLDEERMWLGEAYGVQLHTANEWLSYAYDYSTDGIFNAIRGNPAYADIDAPSHLRSRMLMEDIPTGILPMLELGIPARLDLKLMQTVLNMSEALLGENFRTNGRTLAKLGLEGSAVSDIRALVGYSRDAPQSLQAA